MRDTDAGAIRATSEGWEGALALRFAREASTTRLVHREHCGPLRIQKTLYPEGGEVCQAVIVHPPGGIAGGDRLDIFVDIGPRAHAQLITPGAAKWYRSGGREAIQNVQLHAGDAGIVEWLPHEAILFDDARACMRTSIVLAGRAVAIAWDIVCLGRTASGERFRSGVLQQRIELVRDGALVWVEQNVFEAASRMRASPVGLHDHPAFGTMLIAAPAIDRAWLATARGVGSEIAANDRAVTHVPGALLMRCRAISTLQAQAWFRALWRALRPLVLGREADFPRLWST
jgi:urease accessory protein